MHDVRGAAVAARPVAGRLRITRWRSEYVVIAGVAAVVGVAIVVPLVVVIARSFQVQQGLFESTWSLTNYGRLLTPTGFGAVVNSLVIGLGSALIATVIGVTLAWTVSRTNMPFARFFETANMIPFFLSPMLGAIAWIYVGSPAIGLLNKLLQAAGLVQQPVVNVYSLAGIIWVSGLFHAPFVYLLSSSGLRQMDTSMEHAARISGSGLLVTMLRVTLPLASPAIISGAILAFVLGIEDLATPLVLGYSHGIQTLSTLIYDGVQKYPPDYNFGAAVGCVLMLLCGASILAQRVMTNRRSYVTVTGRGFRPEPLLLGRGRWVAFALNLLYLLVAIVMPIGTLALVSVTHAWVGVVDFSQMSFEHYTYLVTSNDLALTGIANSLILATVGATLTMACSLVVAYGIQRTEIRGRRLLDILTSIPVGIPGVALAVGLLITLIRTPLYATIWILLVGYFVRYFPYGQRTIGAAIMAVSTDFEEASRVGGGSWITTMRRVVVPLVRPGLVAGWLLLFISLMREVSISTLLARTGSQTIAVALFSLLTFDPAGAAAAYTVVQVVLILVFALVFLRLVGAEGARGAA